MKVYEIAYFPYTCKTANDDMDDTGRGLVANSMAHGASTAASSAGVHIKSGERRDNAY
jgi:hypothetical protein